MSEPIRKMHFDPTEVRPTERQLMWQSLELTAFFHFTVNTFTGKEWGKGTENPNIFQPYDLDCRQWIRTIKDAGFKLAILTAKHHDGFCLWPTRHTNHSVCFSTWEAGHGDVLREFVDACREYDILPGVYLSPWDRNHPDYGSDAYNDHFDAQLREVLTGYGPFYEVWFDGACGEGPNGKKQVYDWSRYYSTIRELAPQAVISICGPDVRWVGNEHGYGHKTEWNIVPEGHFDQIKIEESFQEFHYEEREGLETTTPAYKNYPKSSPSPQPNGEKWAWYPSEVDVSIRPGWFYHKSQNRLVKSHFKLVDIYYSSVGYGSGLLLNFPPDRRGHIHENDVKRLKAVAETLRRTFDTPLGGTDISPVDISNDGTTMSFSLPDMVTFDRVVLQEDIAQGQFIETFQVEYQNAKGEWKHLAHGTTIGYKRILRTKKVKAKGFRVTVLTTIGKQKPNISSVKIYKSSPRDRVAFWKVDK